MDFFLYHFYVYVPGVHVSAFESLLTPGHHLDIFLQFSWQVFGSKWLEVGCINLATSATFSNLILCQGVGITGSNIHTARFCWESWKLCSIYHEDNKLK